MKVTGPRAMPTQPTFTQHLSIPPTPRPVGAGAPIITPNFGQNFALASIGIVQGAAWNAGPVISFIIEIGNGVNFRLGPSGTLTGGTWRDRQNNVVTQSDLRFTIKSTDRVIRITPTILQASSIGYLVRTA